MKKSTGILITFEGTEGSGKSTLIGLIYQHLIQQSIPAIVTREPGGTSLSERIRSLLLGSAMDPMTELFLYEAARSEHFQKTIKPALAQGKWVLCDRYTDSTLAYQGTARGIPHKSIRSLNRLATEDRTPDLTFFLDLDPATGLKRATHPNRFEREGLAFQKKVWNGFKEIARKEKRRVRTIQVKDKNPTGVFEETLPYLEKFFSNRSTVKLT